MAMTGGWGISPSNVWKGRAVAPPRVTVFARVPPADAVAPTVTVRIAAGEVSFGISKGILSF
jgi:hypothetical protein